MPTSPEKLKRDKYSRIMRERGMPMLVDPAPVRRHLLSLTQRADGGMTQRMIRKASGVSESVISEIVAGARSSHTRPPRRMRIHRDTATKLLAVTYAPPEGAAPRGARTDPTGTQRRIQALFAIGFGSMAVAEHLAMGSRAQVNLLLRPSLTYVYGSTAGRVREMYEKLADTDPTDLGYGAASIGRARGTALRNGWAPPSCWDADTIDDPGAVPEWTGACGTVAGYRLHRRYDIPSCRPCLQAKYAERRKENEE